jgi:hypothetical protein
MYKLCDGDFIETTFGDLPIGAKFLGIASHDLYTKLTNSEARIDEGVGLGRIVPRFPNNRVLVKVVYEEDE